MNTRFLPVLLPASGLFVEFYSSEDGGGGKTVYGSDKPNRMQTCRVQLSC